MKTRLLPAAVLLCAALLLSPTLAAVETPESVLACYWNGTLIVDGTYNPLLRNQRGTADDVLIYQGATYIPLTTAAAWMGCSAAWRDGGDTLVLTRDQTPGLIPSHLQESWTEADLAQHSAYKANGCPAVLRRDMTVLLDGQVCPFAASNGQPLCPLQFWGDTYLPLRPVGELCGKQVLWLPPYTFPNPNYPEREPNRPLYWTAAEILLFDPISPAQKEAGQAYLDSVSALREQIQEQVLRLSQAQSYDAPHFAAALADLDASIHVLMTLPDPDCPVLENTFTSVRDHYAGYRLLDELDFVHELAEGTWPTVSPWADSQSEYPLSEAVRDHFLKDLRDLSSALDRAQHYLDALP